MRYVLGRLLFRPATGHEVDMTARRLRMRLRVGGAELAASLWVSSASRS